MSAERQGKTPEKPRKTSRIRIEDLDTFPATQAKNRFGELLHRVSYEKQPVLIERSGRPMAVVVDLEQYLELVQRPAADSPEKRARR